MVSFVNPNTDGEFSFSRDLSTIKTICAENNVKLFISIGGGGVSLQETNTYKTKTTSEERGPFINNLMNYVRQNGIEGIDVDLEGELVSMDTYDDFVKELSDSLHAENLEMSSALGSYYSTFISDFTLSLFDFINIMSYDKKGSWTPTSPGQHSSLDHAKNDLVYFNQTRNVPIEKLVLGVPFYGWEFDDGATTSNDVRALTYCQILNLDENNKNYDEAVTETGTVYYNGVSTIEAKIDWVINQKAGGIMIWELGQDCFNNNSLLTVIDNKMGPLSISNNSIAQFKVFPTITSDELSIEFNSQTIQNYTFTINNINGAIVIDENKLLNSINVRNLESGIYFLVISNSSHQEVVKFIKI